MDFSPNTMIASFKQRLSKTRVQKELEGLLDGRFPSGLSAGQRHEIELEEVGSWRGQAVYLGASYTMLKDEKTQGSKICVQNAGLFRVGDMGMAPLLQLERVSIEGPQAAGANVWWSNESSLQASQKDLASEDWAGFVKILETVPKSAPQLKPSAQI